VRNKADRSLRKKRKSDDMGNDAKEELFVRARVDIRDLNIDGLNTFQQDDKMEATQKSSRGGGGGGGDDEDKVAPKNTKLPIVAVAKHLCGVATDLGLRSLLTTRNSQPAASSLPNGEVEGGGGGGGDDWPGKSIKTNELNVAGVCIATCCHHCCSWDDYVAKGLLVEVCCFYYYYYYYYYYYFVNRLLSFLNKISVSIAYVYYFGNVFLVDGVEKRALRCYVQVKWLGVQLCAICSIIIIIIIIIIITNHHEESSDGDRVRN
jgi:hypothetical protein